MGTLLGNSQSNLTNAASPGPRDSQQVNEVDQLSELQEFAWQVGNGPKISFPVNNVADSISQDLAIHKYPDLDGARIENTGRNPIEVSCTAIFVNTITPGEHEHWGAGTLFPNVYQAVLNSSLLRDTGTLWHPFIGPFTAKLQSFHSTFNADFRGGAVADLHFIETINDDNILDTIESKVPSATGAAFTLDSAIQKATPDQLAKLKQHGFDPDMMAGLLKGLSIVASIEIIFSQIAGIISNPSVYSVPILGSVLNTGIFLANKFGSACQQSNDIALANAQNAAMLFLAALLDAQSKLNSQNSRPILIYITKVPSTLSSLSKLLNTSLPILMSLNPNLLQLPSVAANISVRYEG